jgi:hypothetical protein
MCVIDARSASLCVIDVGQHLCVVNNTLFALLLSSGLVIRGCVCGCIIVVFGKRPAGGSAAAAPQSAEHFQEDRP